MSKEGSIWDHDKRLGWHRISDGNDLREITSREKLFECSEVGMLRKVVEDFFSFVGSSFDHELELGDESLVLPSSFNEASLGHFDVIDDEIKQDEWCW